MNISNISKIENMHLILYLCAIGKIRKVVTNNKNYNSLQLNQNVQSNSVIYNGIQISKLV